MVLLARLVLKTESYLTSISTDFHALKKSIDVLYMLNMNYIVLEQELHSFRTVLRKIKVYHTDQRCQCEPKAQTLLRALSLLYMKVSGDTLPCVVGWCACGDV